jgi:hypothetical protein
LKILFTQHGLVNPGGTELFIAEVTSALHARGHHVAVYAGQEGEPAERLRSRGVAVVTDPRDCPWEPDIIHGQHRIHALKALAAFPLCPAVLHLHGFLPDLEKPFIHPRIIKYLVTSPWLSERWSKGLGLPLEKFEVVLNHVDTSRFTTTKTPPVRPREALVYGNSGIDEKNCAILREACDAVGIDLDMAGMVAQRYEASPEQLLPRYDLVFAVGRCALEAAACGCGVIPVYKDMADQLLGIDNYERLRAQNMSVRLSRHEKLTTAWITAQIGQWKADDVARVAERVRKEASLDDVTDQLVGIYKTVVHAYTESPRIPLEEELRASLAVLRDENWQELFQANMCTLQLKERLHSMEKSWSWRLTYPLRVIDGTVKGRETATGVATRL